MSAAVAGDLPLSPAGWLLDTMRLFPILTIGCLSCTLMLIVGSLSGSLPPPLPMETAPPAPPPEVDLKHVGADAAAGEMKKEMNDDDPFRVALMNLLNNPGIKTDADLVLAVKTLVRPDPVTKTAPSPIFSKADLDVSGSHLRSNVCGVYTDGKVRLYGGADAEGRPHGYALWIGKDDVAYEGMYRHGVKEGAGTLYWPDGKRWVGVWHQDKQFAGVFIDCSGKCHVQQWHDGKCEEGRDNPVFHAMTRPLFSTNEHDAIARIIQEQAIVSASSPVSSGRSCTASLFRRLGI